MTLQSGKIKPKLEVLHSVEWLVLSVRLHPLYFQ